MTTPSALYATAAPMAEARGFAAFPPGTRRRARTWWGSAWIQAMADTAVDAGLTRRGRRMAADGRVGPITISAGRITALLDATHHTSVDVEPLSATAWAHLVTDTSVQSGHLAALLDGQLPHPLGDLVPAVGALDARCTCDDWGNPCQHAAALCYQTAWLLDADPALLLLIRGSSIEAFTGAVADRNTPAGDAITLAAEAFARPVPPLPEPPPPATGEVRLLSIEAPPGFDAGTLYGAAAAAVNRARRLLAP